ncbi:MAG: Ig-like domain-containing protein [Gemmatimonadaceae bacterium]
MSIVVSARPLARRRYAKASSVFVLGVCGACGGGGTEPERVGPPAAVVVSAGNQQTGQAGALLTAPIAAKVTDASGRGVANMPVTFTVTAGEGSIEPSTNRTNGAGIATVSWRVGTIAGSQQQVVATVLDTLTGTLVDTAIFAANVTAGVPATVAPIGGNGAVIATGQTTPVSLRAVVRDAYGNLAGGATVNWTLVEGQATLSAATSATSSQGEATTTLTPAPSTGDILVRASVAGVSSPASFVVRISRPATVFPAGRSEFVIAIGQTTPLSLRVVVRDDFGNPFAGATVDWTVVQGQATLATPASTSDALGEATNTVTPAQSTGDIVVRASIAGVASQASFLIQPRSVSERAVLLQSGAFGIARTSGGQLVVTLSHSGRLERVSTTDPSSSTVMTVGGNPVVIAVDAGGQLGYVSNSARGTLQVIDIPSMTPVAEVDVPGDAHALALSPRGDRVYVTNTEFSVFAVDVATRAIVRTIPTGAGPWGIAFWTTATDSLMYVTARNGASITEVDMRTGSVVRTIAVTGRPHGISISPDGRTLYVADDTGGEILFVDRASGATTRRITAAGAFGIAIAPDGNTLYVTTNPGSILVVDVASATITKRFETGGQARQILVMPDGNTALAANMSGWVDLVRR